MNPIENKTVTIRVELHREGFTSPKMFSTETMDMNSLDVMEVYWSTCPNVRSWYEVGEEDHMRKDARARYNLADKRDAWIMHQIGCTPRKDRAALRRLDLLPRLGCGPDFHEIPAGWDRV